ncbi:MAG: hypothetical protein RQ722_10475, partial [Desulfuromonadales bacterium]|nr:hypothetical protein [Desulfuromonadales bacterium]
CLPRGFKVVHEQSELDTEKQAPAEEQPLGQLPPVARIFPINYLLHDHARYYGRENKKMTLVKLQDFGDGLY